jgi:hypothetical protein
MDGIDFNSLGLRTTGRAKTLVFNLSRELNEGDLALLEEPRAAKAPEIKKLRERHHALAKFIAQGIRPGDAGLMCGYSGSRVSILQADRAFQELVVFYRDAGNERYLEHKVALSELGLDAVEEIRERMEENPEDVSLGQLMEIAKLALDRSGFGPSSTSEVKVNIGLADRMTAARKRIAELRDITPIEGDSISD